MPELEKYNGKGCPLAHLRAYCSDLIQLQDDDGLLIWLFQKSLTSPTLTWFMSLETSKITTWNGLCQLFLDQYSYNLDNVAKREGLEALH